MFLKAANVNCTNCYKPAGRRLALFEVRDDYECYAESYVKCFWSLCDHNHSSHENILRKTENQVISMQPQRQKFKNPVYTNDILVKN